VSITLQRAQAVAILQWATTIGWGFSFLPHIIANAPLSNRFVVDDCFLILGLFCYCWSSFHDFGSYFAKGFLFLSFCWLFVLIFSLGCVYSCFYLPCTFDRWVFVLDFLMWGFSLVMMGCESFDLSLTFSFVFRVMVLIVDFYLIFCPI